jgi:DNA-damage-inducible protein J
MNTTINIRIDKKVKKEAIYTLSELGLDMSTAVKMFLHQVVVEQGLPFTPRRNATAIRKGWDAQVKDALSGPRYKTAEELHRALFKHAK